MIGRWSHCPCRAPFDATLATAERFAEAAHAVNEELGGTAIHSVSMLVGNLITPSVLDKDFNDSHSASIRAHLNEKPLRTVSPQDIERLWRRELGDISYLEKTEFRTTRRRPKPSVAYALKHEDADVLSMVSLPPSCAATGSRLLRLPVFRLLSPARY